MNQRQKRARDRRRAGQDVGASTMHTGGHVSAHRRAEDPVIRTPQRATGDVPGDKANGLAKASPFFKKLEDTLEPETQEAEAKAIAGAVEDPVGEAEQEAEEEVETEEEETQEEDSEEETTE